MNPISTHPNVGLATFYKARAHGSAGNGLGEMPGCFAICGLIAFAIAALLVIGLNAEPSDQLAEKIQTMPGSSN